MKGFRAILAAMLVTASLSSGKIASAGTLGVEPILLEMNAPAASAVIKLRNDENVAVTVQTRVQRWSQVDGVERLDPSMDVVSSPPAVRMTPHSDYIVRVVRIAKTPVQGEECYRAIIDQLPSNPLGSGAGINLLIRQSIPVFFRARQLDPPKVAWSLRLKGDRLFVTASNAGDERLRIASLRLRDKAGRSVFFGNGLVGYVLGRSSISWPVPPHPRDFGQGGAVSVSALTDRGDLRAVAR